MASVMLPLFLPAGLSIDKLLRAQIALILFAAAYLAEVVRGGLQAVPRTQYEMADALGLTYLQRTAYVVLPQALRIAVPPLVNTFVGLFKDTSLVVIIGLFDLLQTIKVSLNEPAWSGFGVEAYLFAALVYFVFCFAMSRYSRTLEINRGASPRPSFVPGSGSAPG
jgi:general L-amino acid transport system permease protein